MLRGTLVGLRARLESDIPILHAGLYDDVLTTAQSDARAWRPLSPTATESPFRLREPVPHVAPFTVVALDDDRILGDAVLWRIDEHNRAAHLGISLLPEARGRGAGLDTVEVMCHYAFVVLGLHRVQIETNADNAAMLAVARRAGFQEEGTLRDAGWVYGRFVDEVVFGLLAEEWVGRRDNGRSNGDPDVVPSG